MTILVATPFHESAAFAQFDTLLASYPMPKDVSTSQTFAEYATLSKNQLNDIRCTTSLLQTEKAKFSPAYEACERALIRIQ